MTAEQRRDAANLAQGLDKRAANGWQHIAALLRAGIAASEEAERLRAHVCTDNSATLANALAEIDRLRGLLKPAVEMLRDGRRVDLFAPEFDGRAAMLMAALEAGR